MEREYIWIIETLMYISTGFVLGAIYGSYSTGKKIIEELNKNEEEL